MYKLSVLFLIAFLTACNGSRNPEQTSATVQREAIALKDSALKLMNEPVGTYKFDESLNLLNAALAKDPKLKSAYFYKMKFYSEKGDDENAFRTLIALNKANPGDAFSTLNVGIEYERRDSLQKAQTNYAESVTLFENALDTISESSPLVRNTYIMNLALATTLAGYNSGSEAIRSEWSAPERENFDIALNTFKGMTRQALLNIHKSQSGGNE